MLPNPPGGGDASARALGGRAVPIPAMHADALAGWHEVPTFHEPIKLRLEGEMLTVNDTHERATVSLRDLHHVEVEQFSNGKTALAIGAPVVGAVLLAMIFAATCTGTCLYTGRPG
jgi:hypothetical protein